MAAVAGARRQARERALGLLYEAETKGEPPTAVLASLPVDPDPYATAIVEGVERQGGEIDGLIAGHAIGWALGRMPAVDRSLLRLATFELLGRPDTPTGVVISEAVELAKEYSTDESGRFVNGVLSAIALAVRPQPPADTRASS
ncbi:MAG: transcription antitermination factor NusB [Acidimicrobiales bacterium]